MSMPFREEDIPVLTEVIEDAAPQAAPQPLSAVISPPVPADRGSAVPLSNSADREALERKLQERILRQLQGQIDAVLEHQVRDVLADVLQTAVSQLADDIRTQLQASMENIVTQAVKQEVAKLDRDKEQAG
jgi:outer membrane lipopolysaccharide assembly protein LptE/RlpB